MIMVPGDKCRLSHQVIGERVIWHELDDDGHSDDDQTAFTSVDHNSTFTVIAVKEFGYKPYSRSTVWCYVMVDGTISCGWIVQHLIEPI